MDSMKGLMIGSGALSAFGQIWQGIAARRQANTEAAIARSNAKRARGAAAEAVSRGQFESRRHLIRTRQFAGSQRAAYGAGGVDVGFGSPADIVEETKRMGDVDAATIRYNAAQEAWGLKAKAVDYTTQAGMLRVVGQDALMSGIASGAGTMLTTMGSVASRRSRRGYYAEG